MWSLRLGFLLSLSSASGVVVWACVGQDPAVTPGGPSVPDGATTASDAGEEASTPTDGGGGGGDGGCRYRAEVVADAPLHYFRFKAGTGVLDEMNATADAGQLIGAATIVGPGAITCEKDEALATTAVGTPPGVAELFGADYDFPAKTAFSIELWVLPGPQPAENEFGRVFARDHVVGDAAAYKREGYNVTYTVAAGTTSFKFSRVEGIQNQPGTDEGAAFVLGPQPMTYKHVVATFDGSINRLYVDGSLVAASAPSTISITPNNARTLLGARSPQENEVYSNRFTGKIDEVAVYAKALSAERVNAHFTAAH